MKVIKIPKKILDITLGENYSYGDYTLRDELGKLVNEIIHVEYEVNNGRLELFIAYTEDHICILTEILFGQKIVCTYDRNPRNDKKRRISKNVKRDK